MCGLAGAYLAVIYTRSGWRAWSPAGLDCAGAHHICHLAALRVLFGAYLFGGVTMMQFHLQSQGRYPQSIPVHGALPRHHRGAGIDFA